MRAGNNQRSKRNGNADIGYVNTAYELLSCIHFALKAEQDDANSKSTLPALDSKSTRVVLCLAELLLLLGITPFLAEGVGIPAERRPKPLLPHGLQKELKDSTRGLWSVNLLETLLDNLLAIIQDTGRGIEPLLSDSMRGDILCAAAQLAFATDSQAEDQLRYSKMYKSIIEKYVDLDFFAGDIFPF